MHRMQTMLMEGMRASVKRARRAHRNHLQHWLTLVESLLRISVP